MLSAHRGGGSSGGGGARQRAGQKNSISFFSIFSRPSPRSSTFAKIFRATSRPVQTRLAHCDESARCGAGGDSRADSRAAKRNDALIAALDSKRTVARVRELRCGDRTRDGGLRAASGARIFVSSSRRGLRGNVHVATTFDRRGAARRRRMRTWLVFAQRVSRGRHRSARLRYERALQCRSAGRAVRCVACGVRNASTESKDVEIGSVVGDHVRSNIFPSGALRVVSPRQARLRESGRGSSRDANAEALALPARLLRDPRISARAIPALALLRARDHGFERLMTCRDFIRFRDVDDVRRGFAGVESSSTRSRRMFGGQI